MFNKEETKIYTVSELTKDIKFILEGNFMRIWVEGEVSGITKSPSGHLYFKLKDQNALLECVMFKGYQYKGLNFMLEEGAKVQAFGKVTVYEIRGQLQLAIEKMKPAGAGDLLKQYEELKKKLLEEGLFDEKHKKPLPFIPRRIGIVTSATGAAIRDMIRIIHERFPAKILLYPSLVQGEDAPAELIAGLQALNKISDIDVIIIGRGGGSIEDLWAFNNENLVRAIFASEKPVISAVGHEIDFTLSDFVADKRAATPSTAAEMVVPKITDLQVMLHDSGERIHWIINRQFEDNKYKFLIVCDDLEKIIEQRLEKEKNSFYQISKHLLLLHPKMKLKNYGDSFRSCAQRLFSSIRKNFDQNKHDFEIFQEKLKTLSPLACLNRGYSITRKLPECSIVRSSKSLKKDDRIEVLLGEGKAKGLVEEIE